MTEMEMVIGIEIHAELSTQSKIFCACPTHFGAKPNTQVCPVCMGLPGTLPVLNEQVVTYATKAGLATHCSISNFSKQDRKNYFYPDLPKAYQISQYDLPLCKNGFVTIKIGDISKKIGITRIHIEEDAGKLCHGDGDTTLIDYNRCGVPLIEIVSEPDMRSAEEAKAYVEKVKSILEYIDVSNCKMQEGSLRADINLSVRPKGQPFLGTRTETKNLNSFRSILRAIEYEAQRQIDVIQQNGSIQQETRRWDDDKGVGYAMRTKEDAHDYRYFPDPDLPPIILSHETIEDIQASMPMLPDERMTLFTNTYGLPEYDAMFITASKKMADFFEEATKTCTHYKALSNWLMGDVSKALNDAKKEISEIPLKPKYLAELINAVDSGSISGSIGKKVFKKMFETGEDPISIIRRDNLQVITDPTVIQLSIEKVLMDNPKSVSDYHNGKEKAVSFLIGKVMAATGGKAEPQILKQLLVEALSKTQP